MRSVPQSRFWPYLGGAALSLGAGALSAFISRGSMERYGQINLPPLSPSGWVFPVVWTVLFLLMGIASALVFLSASPGRKRALTLYAVQLFVNILWPVLFFNLQAYFPAFLWLCLLWLFILATMLAFYKIQPVAGLLLLPYLLWVTFAGYLNLGVALLNP